MKQTTTSAASALKIINGKKCVRVLDLAKKWGTSTATILATDKPHAVPDKYIHRINGRAWCELEGLRQRANAVKDRKSSYISREILAFLDGLEKPEASKPTDLDTAALIADVRRTASQALAKTEDNAKRVETLEKHMDAAELVVKSAANIAEEASEAVDRVGSSAQQQLDRLSEHVDRVEKDAIAHRCDALQRVRQAERKQRDNTARIQTLEEQARALDWTLAAVAVLTVAAHVIRLLRRR